MMLIHSSILKYYPLSVVVSDKTKLFKRGDHVEWNSEAGRVRGIIVRKVTSNVRFKGYVHHASKDEPHYIIKSDTTPITLRFTKDQR